MRSFLLFFCILQIVPCHAQFTDNFSDGLFHHDDENYRLVNWEGDTAHFKVNREFQLQSNAPAVTGDSQLRTRSSRVRNTSWEFYLHFKFGVTANNYGKIFLVSDSEHLNEKLNGLYVRIGYIDKNVCLVRAYKDKHYEAIIEGEKNRLSGNKVELRVRVEMDQSGVVSLYSQKPEEAGFVLEGSTHLGEIPSGNYFGLLCTYTKSRSKSFCFDDFIVKKLDETIEDTDNPEPEEPDTPEEKEPSSANVLFSEVMAHPTSGAAEYVELYNASDKTILLSDYVFYYGDKSFNLPDEEMESGSYAVLCKSSYLDLFSSKVHAIGINSFPTLSNTGKLLMLKDTKGNLIAWFEYSNTMYNDTNKKDGGWSLECIDLNNISNTAENWTASVDLSGGTPGRENSTKKENKDTILPKISSFTFDQDRLILHFSKPMNRESLLNINHYSFSHSAYTIKNLTTNDPQGTQLTIDLNRELNQEEWIELQTTGIKDLTGNALETNMIILGYAHAPTENDLLINEILFNPPSGGTEYIEIYNHSDQVIDLRFTSIATRKTLDNTFNKLCPLSHIPQFIYPEEYLLLTKNEDQVCHYYSCSPDSYCIELSSLLSFNNTSGCVVLINNKTNEIIDEFAYQESMHTTENKSKKGISLERVSWNIPTNNADNWQSASENSGFGTPGYENSRQESINDNDSKRAALSIDYPDHTDEHYRFTYQVDASDYTGSLRIYDSSGKLIHTFKDNESLARQETIRWNRNSFSLHPGICILFLEAYSSKGKTIKEKIPFAVK